MGEQKPSEWWQLPFALIVVVPTLMGIPVMSYLAVVCLSWEWFGVALWPLT